MDLKIAFRRLTRTPVFFVTASLSLALGIGATTAAFSVIHAVLLRSLPVRDPAALAIVATRNTGFQYSMSYPAYTYLRDHAASLDGLVAFRPQPVNVAAAGVTDRVTGMLVSDGYFGVLGVAMAAGAPLQRDDEVVLGHRYWQRRFGRSGDVIGTSIRINGHPFRIAGVASRAFHGTAVGSLPDVFVPMTFAPRLFDVATWLTNPRNHWLRIIARVRPEVGMDRAQAEMTVVFRQFGQQVLLPLAATDTQRRRAREGLIVLEAGWAGLLEMGNTVRPALFALAGLVGLVLVVACVNVSNLMVARAERLHRDTAIALALGATWFRLWRQSLIESAAVGAAGVSLGLVVALAMRGLLLELLPPRHELDVSIDGRVFGAAVLLTGLTTVALAFVAARHGTRVATARALKGEDLAARLWLRKGLIVAQLALAVVALAAASLFAQTLTALREVDPGFERERLLVVSTATDGYTPERRRAFYEQLLAEARALPGVAAAALASDEPLSVNTGWTIVSRRDPAGSPVPGSTSVAFISRDYFTTMGIPLVKGRDFAEREQTGPPGPVIVNEHFVRTHLPAGQEPIGVTVTANGGMTFEIVGVVKDSASAGLRDLDQQVLYVPRDTGVLHVRSTAAPEGLIPAIRAVVQRLDPGVPVVALRTIEEQLDRSLRTERAFALLSSAFGTLALVLSAVGLYGVMASAVSRRTKELGIRLALGAAPPRIVQLVLGEAGRLVIAGLAVGIPCAVLMARAIRSLLFGMQPGDWRQVVPALAVLVVVAALAAWIPARRAARVDPMTALRSE